jgi:nicotinamide-nucleotide amidase
MKAEIITTGTELLLGETSDTNTAYLAGQLAELGIDLYYTSIIGDNYERMMEALKQAWERSDLIILTGGLGPTQGDITREVIAGMLGEIITLDDDLKKDLESYFTRLGNIGMASNNLKQAALIPSSVPLNNDFGTAPGWFVEKQDKIIVALPGPPREMKPMWRKEVLPLLETKASAVILSRNLKTWGISEAKVDQLLSQYLSSSNPTVAIYARPDGIRVRVTAKAGDRKTASQMIADREAEIRKIFQDHIWGSDDDTLEEVVGRLLEVKRLTIAVAESITHGSLSYSLANTTFSTGYFKGSMIVGREETRALLGIPTNKTPCNETSQHLASRVRELFQADIGVCIDGNISSGNNQVTATAYIAIETGTSDERISQTISMRPDLMVRRAANHALFILRKLMLSK